MVWAAGHELQNGKYVVQGVLGQGGFGITYKVCHIRLDTTVVIKTPNEHLKHDPDYSTYVDRFIREGQMMERFSRYSHPHIVRVRDLFEESDTPCMVMDFVEGENLFQWVRRKGLLTEAEILPCIRQIGEALASLHQAGLVHRDAHPGNIMRCEDGRAVLIDFGIAKELVPTTQSSTGQAGNRGFAPYEQIIQGSREVTVDIYCLAASLYYAVTGQRPMEAAARKLENKLLIEPQQHNRGLSDYVNQAILKGMALEAKDRPRSMAEWLQLLEEVPKVIPSPVPSAASFFHERIATPTVDPTPPFGSFSQRPNSFSSEQPDFLLRRVTRKSRAFEIPWGLLLLLLGLLAGYSVLGFLLNFFRPNDESFVSAYVAMAVLLAFVMAWFGAGTGTPTIGLTMVGFALWGWSGGGFWIGILALVAAGVVAVVGTRVGGKLLESFNRWQTFLVLFGFSVGGLGLGWWLRLLFPSGT